MLLIEKFCFEGDLLIYCCIPDLEGVFINYLLDYCLLVGVLGLDLFVGVGILEPLLLLSLDARKVLF